VKALISEFFFFLRPEISFRERKRPISGNVARKDGSINAAIRATVIPNDTITTGCNRNPTKERFCTQFEIVPQIVLMSGKEASRNQEKKKKKYKTAAEN
jgi:hypothetical protein